MRKLCGLTMVVLLGSVHVSAAELSTTTSTAVTTGSAKTLPASNRSTPKAGLQVFDLKLAVSSTDAVTGGKSAKSVGAKPIKSEQTATNSKSSKQASATPKVLKPVKRKVLIFTASWCGACQALKYEFPALKQVGWRIGGKGTDHIQMVDADLRYDLMSRYGVSSLPTLVLVDGDKELSRSGSLGARNIAEFYYGRLK
jgi:thiol-disulfide isomerase/thioredoxin